MRLILAVTLVWLLYTGASAGMAQQYVTRLNAMYLHIDAAIENAGKIVPDRGMTGR